MSLRSEFDLFIDAMQLLTRLPTPAKAAPSADAIARSARYFPLVGMIVGALAACVLLTAGLRLTSPLPALLAIAAGALITGGFHEDGVADTADALGGGQSRDQRLMIMKDSRIGTYGALALGLSTAIRVLALAAIAPPLAAAAALVAAHCGGRAAVVVAMALLPYGGDPHHAKFKPVAIGVGRREMWIAVAFGLIPLLFNPPRVAVFAFLGGCVAACWPALGARRLIGGYTGDVLGAVEQAFEAGALLGAAAAQM